VLIRVPYCNIYYLSLPLIKGEYHLMLRAGFIGFGRMGITHFSILNTHPSVNVVAICEQSRTMLSILKKHIRYRENHDGWIFDHSGDPNDPIVALVDLAK